MSSLRTFATLWLPVPVFAAAGWLLVRGDLVVQDGVPDLDPLFGLATLFIIAVAACGAVVALVVAAVGSFSRRSRAALTLANAIWTAVLLVLFTVHLAVATYLEPEYADSSALGGQIPFQVAAGVLAIVPLALVLLGRRSARARRLSAAPQPSGAGPADSRDALLPKTSDARRGLS